MAKQKKNKEQDVNELAYSIVQQATEENPPKESSSKNPHAVALGRLGGLKGGKARAKKLTKNQRKEIAQKAAKARWLKK
ncbi:MAG TPA: hypothetical protein VMW42_08035 [Desulfatiglandales bacterium]|nr:hypothetical protein [Desulfatiglandales bacterium]